MVHLFAMVGTVAAAIAALSNSKIAKDTLEEQSQNNKMALKPFIVIRSKEINLSVKSQHIPHLVNWDTGLFDLNRRTVESNSYIEVVNLSNGIAKNVKIAVSLENIADFLNSEIDNPGPYDFIKIEKRKNTNRINQDVIYLEYSIKGRPGFDTFEIDILPETNHLFIESYTLGSAVMLKIPRVFMFLYNLYFILPSYRTKKIAPELKIDIQCEDLIGTPYSFSYRVSLTRLKVTEKLGETNIQSYFGIQEY